jgi:hypothetical protein
MVDSIGPRPQLAYWHLWTGEDGITHQTECRLEEFEIARVGAAAPQWNDAQRRGEATVVFTVQPVGWIGDWIVVLSGRWWIESMDGTRIEQGPGEFSLGEDQGSILCGGRQGHRSGTLGVEPAVLMTVQMHVAPLRVPCHLS